jgi:hypothetical protein
MTRALPGTTRSLIVSRTRRERAVGGFAAHVLLEKGDGAGELSVEGARKARG